MERQQDIIIDQSGSRSKRTMFTNEVIKGSTINQRQDRKSN
jgi:hypothetical protein